MKTCECIVTIQNAGYELGLKGQMFDVTKDEDKSLQIETGYSIPTKRGKSNTFFRITHCPFCGRPLHEVTPETMAARTDNEEKETL